MNIKKRATIPIIVMITLALFGCSILGYMTGLNSGIGEREEQRQLLIDALNNINCAESSMRSLGSIKVTDGATLENLNIVVIGGDAGIEAYLTTPESLTTMRNITIENFDVGIRVHDLSWTWEQEAEE